MADKELKVIIKAKELMKYTYTVTSNCKNFPKKFRHSMVDRMQLKTMDIYETLYEANRTNINTEKGLRIRHQGKAVNYCDELMAYIELAKELNIIDIQRMEYWSSLAADVKHMTLAWLKKDRERTI